MSPEEGCTFQYYFRVQYLITYRIAEKFAGIKFGDFSQNAVFLNLADFKFGDSVQCV